MRNTEALEIVSQDGDIVAHYCYRCGDSKLEDLIMPTDRLYWIEEGDRSRNWTCDRCGITIKKANMSTSSDPYLRMFKVITEKWEK